MSGSIVIRVKVFNNSQTFDGSGGVGLFSITPKKILQTLTYIGLLVLA